MFALRSKCIVLLLIAMCIPLVGHAQGDTWATKAPMPTAVTGMVAGAIDGKLYVVGGSLGVCPSSAALQVYDPATDMWTTMAPLPVPRHAAGAGVIDGKLYVAGGSSNACADPGNVTLYRYDPGTNIWTPKADMLQARAGHAVAVIDGKLYALGGAADGSSFEMYDPVTDAWTARGSFPTAISNPAVGVVNGKLYAAGGLQFCCASLATLREYDPATNAWTSKASLPSGRNQAAGGVINGVFYVAAGINPAGTDVTNTLFAYDPATDVWTTKAPMSVARATHPAATINGKLYVVGGGIVGGLLSSLEVYTPEVYAAQVQQPIDADGSSVFKVKRGVVPVKFTITYGGDATCELPAATISLIRTAGTVLGSIDESVYLLASDNGSNFRIDDCQYVYNLRTSSLGTGTYRVNISIGGNVVGSGTFGLQ